MLDFDIDKFIKIWGVGIPKPYLERIRAASNAEIKEFRKRVSSHKRQPQKVNFGSEITPKGVKTFSIHNDILFKAIDWELLRRSNTRMWLYKKTLPLRRWWAGFWLGCTLKETEYFGYVQVDRECGKNKLEYFGFKACVGMFLNDVKEYSIHHHWQIITAIISLLGIYVAWLAVK